MLFCTLPQRFGPLEVNNFNYVRKKNGGPMLQAHEGESCGRDLDPQCFCGNGPFLRSTTCSTHYSQKKKKKKEQPNGPKVHMK